MQAKQLQCKITAKRFEGFLYSSVFALGCHLPCVAMFVFAL